LILQPVAVLLLPALCKSILLVASNSRQLSDVMGASGFAGALNERTPAWGSAAQKLGIVLKEQAN
jgi:hypothetical protein